MLQMEFTAEERDQLYHQVFYNPDPDVKKECLYSQYYETFALFKAAIVECLAEVSGKHKQKLASLLTLNFQTFENESL